MHVTPSRRLQRTILSTKSDRGNTRQEEGPFKAMPLRQHDRLQVNRVAVLFYATRHTYAHYMLMLLPWYIYAYRLKKALLLYRLWAKVVVVVARKGSTQP